MVFIMTGKKMSGILKVTRGIRNNNPYNMRKGKSSWKGLVGSDDKGFCVFDNMVNGVRAGTINLRNGYFNLKLNISQIVAKYAPASDDNNETAYIKTIVSFNKERFSPNSVPYTEEDKLLVAKAIIFHENGSNAGVTDEMIIPYL